jgi:hypothetical protein
MKVFLIGVFISFFVLFSSCSSYSTVRADFSTPLDKSCMILTTGHIVINGKRFNSQYVDEKDKLTRIIIPAGKTVLFRGSSVSAFHRIDNDRSSYKYEYRFRGKVYYSGDIIGVFIQRNFDFEPGKIYEITIEDIIVTPGSIDNNSTRSFIDENNNEYFLDPGRDDYNNHFWFGSDETVVPYFLVSISNGKASITEAYRLYRFVIKETKKDLSKTHLAKEYGSIFYGGIRSRNVLGIEIGRTLGFTLFSDPINMHIYGELGLGIGFGLLDYNFSDFGDNFFPGTMAHLGLNTDFNLRKLEIGLGAGYLVGGYSFYSNLGYFGEDDFLEKISSPYLQFTIGGLFEDNLKGSLYIDYYPNITPIYSSFGIGFKGRF